MKEFVKISHLMMVLVVLSTAACEKKEDNSMFSKQPSIEKRDPKKREKRARFDSSQVKDFEDDLSRTMDDESGNE